MIEHLSSFFFFSFTYYYFFFIFSFDYILYFILLIQRQTHIFDWFGCRLLVVQFFPYNTWRVGVLISKKKKKKRSSNSRLGKKCKLSVIAIAE
jgi:hypothetical protein